MSAVSYPITVEQAALVAELNAQVTRAQANLDLAVNVILRGHGVIAATVSAFDPNVPSLTITVPDLPDVPAVLDGSLPGALAPSPESPV